MATVVQPHWRDRAITASERITDGWEVVKSYLARIAEPVLFVMMVANIIEMLPGVTVWPWFSAIVLGIQAVSLDVAGFGLNTMADHARRAGNEKAATKAERTGWLLIGIMIATLLAVATGMLFPQVIWILVYVEKALILIRVALTVWYGYVIHGLRSSDHTAPPTTPSQPSPEVVQLVSQVDTLSGQIATLTEQLNQLQSRQQEDMVVDSSVDDVVDTTVDTEEDESVHTDEHPIVDIANYRSEQKQSPQSSTKPSVNRSEAQQRAMRVVKKHPGIGPTELAQKAQISKSYANRILASMRVKVVER